MEQSRSLSKPPATFKLPTTPITMYEVLLLPTLFVYLPDQLGIFLDFHVLRITGTRSTTPYPDQCTIMSSTSRCRCHQVSVRICATDVVRPYLQIDIDVLGRNNTLVKHSLVPVEAKYSWANSTRSTMKLERSKVENENEGKMNWPDRTMGLSILLQSPSSMT